MLPFGAAAAAAAEANMFSCWFYIFAVGHFRHIVWPRQRYVHTLWRGVVQIKNLVSFPLLSLSRSLSISRSVIFSLLCTHFPILLV